MWEEKIRIYNTPRVLNNFPSNTPKSLSRRKRADFCGLSNDLFNEVFYQVWAGPTVLWCTQQLNNKWIWLSNYKSKNSASSSRESWNTIASSPPCKLWKWLGGQTLEAWAIHYLIFWNHSNLNSRLCLLVSKIWLHSCLYITLVYKQFL